MELLFGLFILGAVLAVYFIPALVASNRRHRNALAIGMLNLFLGWSLLGWVIALVWACTANIKSQYE